MSKRHDRSAIKSVALLLAFILTLGSFSNITFAAASDKITLGGTSGNFTFDLKDDTSDANIVINRTAGAGAISGTIKLLHLGFGKVGNTMGSVGSTADVAFNTVTTPTAVSRTLGYSIPITFAEGVNSIQVPIKVIGKTAANSRWGSNETERQIKVEITTSDGTTLETSTGIISLKREVIIPETILRIYDVSPRANASETTYELPTTVSVLTSEGKTTTINVTGWKKSGSSEAVKTVNPSTLGLGMHTYYFETTNEFPQNPATPGTGKVTGYCYLKVDSSTYSAIAAYKNPADINPIQKLNVYTINGTINAATPTNEIYREPVVVKGKILNSESWDVLTTGSYIWSYDNDNQKATLTLRGGSTVVNATYDYNVLKANLASLTITNNPTTTSYTVATLKPLTPAEINLAGIEVKGNYEHSLYKNYTNADVEVISVNAANLANQVVTVALKGDNTKTATFSVTVTATAPEITNLTFTATIDLQEGQSNVAPGAVVGTLATTGGTAQYTYAFAAGGADNSKFVIEGSNVKVGTAALTAGTYNINVEVTDINNKKLAKAFVITVLESNPIPTITITTNPTNVTIFDGDNTTLTIAANVVPTAAISYQWYLNTTASTTGGTIIAGATGTSLALADLALGAHYYYCEVSSAGAQTKTSQVATVTVNKVELKTATLSTTNVRGEKATVTATFDRPVTAETGAVIEFTDSVSGDKITLDTVAKSGNALTFEGTIPAGAKAGTYKATAITGTIKVEKTNTAVSPLTFTELQIVVGAAALTGITVAGEENVSLYTGETATNVDKTKLTVKAQYEDGSEATILPANYSVTLIENANVVSGVVVTDNGNVGVKVAYSGKETTVYVAVKAVELTTAKFSNGATTADVASAGEAIVNVAFDKPVTADAGAKITFTDADSNTIELTLDETSNNKNSLTFKGNAPTNSTLNILVYTASSITGTVKVTGTNVEVSPLTFGTLTANVQTSSTAVLTAKYTGNVEIYTGDTLAGYETAIKAGLEVSLSDGDISAPVTDYSLSLVDELNKVEDGIVIADSGKVTVLVTRGASTITFELAVKAVKVKSIALETTVGGKNYGNEFAVSYDTVNHPYREDVIINVTYDRAVDATGSKLVLNLTTPASNIPATSNKNKTTVELLPQGTSQELADGKLTVTYKGNFEELNTPGTYEISTVNGDVVVQGTKSTSTLVKIIDKTFTKSQAKLIPLTIAEFKGVLKNRTLYTGDSTETIEENLEVTATFNVTLNGNVLNPFEHTLTKDDYTAVPDTVGFAKMADGKNYVVLHSGKVGVIIDPKNYTVDRTTAELDVYPVTVEKATINSTTLVSGEVTANTGQKGFSVDVTFTKPVYPNGLSQDNEIIFTHVDDPASQIIVGRRGTNGGVEFVNPEAALDAGNKQVSSTLKYKGDISATAKPGKYVATQIKNGQTPVIGNTPVYILDNTYVLVNGNPVMQGNKSFRVNGVITPLELIINEAPIEKLTLTQKANTTLPADIYVSDNINTDEIKALFTVKADYVGGHSVADFKGYSLEIVYEKDVDSNVTDSSKFAREDGTFSVVATAPELAIGSTKTIISGEVSGLNVNPVEIVDIVLTNKAGTSTTVTAEGKNITISDDTTNAIEAIAYFARPITNFSGSTIVLEHASQPSITLTATGACTEVTVDGEVLYAVSYTGNADGTLASTFPLGLYEANKITIAAGKPNPVNSVDNTTIIAGYEVKTAFDVVGVNGKVSVKVDPAPARIITIDYKTDNAKGEQISADGNFYWAKEGNKIIATFTTNNELDLDKTPVRTTGTIGGLTATFAKVNGQPKTYTATVTVPAGMAHPVSPEKLEFVHSLYGKDDESTFTAKQEANEITNVIIDTTAPVIDSVKVKVFKDAAMTIEKDEVLSGSEVFVGLADTVYVEITSDSALDFSSKKTNIAYIYDNVGTKYVLNFAQIGNTNTYWAKHTFEREFNQNTEEIIKLWIDVEDLAGNKGAAPNNVAYYLGEDKINDNVTLKTDVLPPVVTLEEQFSKTSNPHAPITVAGHAGTIKYSIDGDKIDLYFKSSKALDVTRPYSVYLGLPEGITADKEAAYKLEGLTRVGVTLDAGKNVTGISEATDATGSIIKTPGYFYYRATIEKYRTINGVDLGYQFGTNPAIFADGPHKDELAAEFIAWGENEQQTAHRRNLASGIQYHPAHAATYNTTITSFMSDNDIKDVNNNPITNVARHQDSVTLKFTTTVELSTATTQVVIGGINVNAEGLGTLKLTGKTGTSPSFTYAYELTVKVADILTIQEVDADGNLVVDVDGNLVYVITTIEEGKEIPYSVIPADLFGCKGPETVGTGDSNKPQVTYNNHFEVSVKSFVSNDKYTNLANKLRTVTLTFESVEKLGAKTVVKIAGIKVTPITADIATPYTYTATLDLNANEVTAVEVDFDGNITYSIEPYNEDGFPAATILNTDAATDAANVDYQVLYDNTAPVIDNVVIKTDRTDNNAVIGSALTITFESDELLFDPERIIDEALDLNEFLVGEMLIDEVTAEKVFSHGIAVEEITTTSTVAPYTYTAKLTAPDKVWTGCTKVDGETLAIQITARDKAENISEDVYESTQPSKCIKDPTKVSIVIDGLDGSGAIEAYKPVYVKTTGGTSLGGIELSYMNTFNPRPRGAAYAAPSFISIYAEIPADDNAIVLKAGSTPIGTIQRTKFNPDESEYTIILYGKHYYFLNAYKKGSSEISTVDGEADWVSFNVKDATNGIKITAQPQDLKLNVNDTATLTVAAVTVPVGKTLQYQWVKTPTGAFADSQAIGGETNPTFTVPTNAEGTMYYFCVVSVDDNSLPTAPSRFAKVVVGSGTTPTPTITITTHPADIEVEVNTEASLTVEATINSFGLPVIYEWYRVDAGVVSKFAGEILYTDTLTWTTGNTPVEYEVYCVITSGTTTVTSNRATVKVIAGTTPDTTAPTLESVTATIGGTQQTHATDLTGFVGQSVSGTITATLSEAADFVTGTSGNITISGTGITGDVHYGTFTLSGTTATITPAAGNELIGAAGTFTFKVAAGTIKDASGNQNTDITFTLTVTKATLGGTVAITGTAADGQTLTAAVSGATPTYHGTLTYEWLSSSDGTNYTAIAGETASTYTLVTGDLGKTIKVIVTAANCTGSLESTISIPAAATAIESLTIKAPGLLVGKDATGQKEITIADTYATASSEGWWTDETTGAGGGELFAAGSQYIGKIKVTAEAGYEFNTTDWQTGAGFGSFDSLVKLDSSSSLSGAAGYKITSVSATEIEIMISYDSLEDLTVGAGSDEIIVKNTETLDAAFEAITPVPGTPITITIQTPVGADAADPKEVKLPESIADVGEVIITVPVGVNLVFPDGFDIANSEVKIEIASGATATNFDYDGFGGTNTAGLELTVNGGGYLYGTGGADDLIVCPAGDAKEDDAWFSLDNGASMTFKGSGVTLFSTTPSPFDIVLNGGTSLKQRSGKAFVVNEGQNLIVASGVLTLLAPTSSATAADGTFVLKVLGNLVIGNDTPGNDAGVTLQKDGAVLLVDDGNGNLNYEIGSGAIGVVANSNNTITSFDPSTPVGFVKLVNSTYEWIVKADLLQGNLAVAPVITITAQPLGVTTTVGGTANLSVTATVTEGATLEYQWYSNTTNSITGATAVTGATSATYTVPTTTAATTYYYCVVSATGAASKNSAIATVVVNPAPATPVITITAQPQDTTVTVGDTATLSVTATVTEGATLEYQWYSNTTDSNVDGTIIADETNATYSVPTDAADTYYYYCVVSATDATSVTSDVATVIVEEEVIATPVITITAQPQDTTVTVGGTATLSVTATVTEGATLEYQWYSNTTDSNVDGTIIADETNATYSVPTDAADTYYYYCVVSATDATSVTSDVATVIVEEASTTGQEVDIAAGNNAIKLEITEDGKTFDSNLSAGNLTLAGASLTIAGVKVYDSGKKALVAFTTAAATAGTATLTIKDEAYTDDTAPVTETTATALTAVQTIEFTDSSAMNPFILAYSTNTLPYATFVIPAQVKVDGEVIENASAPTLYHKTTDTEEEVTGTGALSRSKIGYYRAEYAANAIGAIAAVTKNRVLYVNPQIPSNNPFDFEVESTEDLTAIKFAVPLLMEGAKMYYALKENDMTIVSKAAVTTTADSFNSSAIAGGVKPGIAYEGTLFYENPYWVEGFANSGGTAKELVLTAIFNAPTDLLSKKLLQGKYTLTFNGADASKSETDKDFVGFLLSNANSAEIQRINQVKVIKNGTAAKTLDVKAYQPDCYVGGGDNNPLANPNPVNFVSFEISGTNGSTDANDYEIAYVEKGIYLIGWEWDENLGDFGGYASYGVVFSKEKLTELGVSGNGWSFEVIYDTNGAVKTTIGTFDGVTGAATVNVNLEVGSNVIELTTTGTFASSVSTSAISLTAGTTGASATVANVERISDTKIKVLLNTAATTAGQVTVSVGSAAIATAGIISGTPKTLTQSVNLNSLSIATPVSSTAYQFSGIQAGVSASLSETFAGVNAGTLAYTVEFVGNNASDSLSNVDISGGTLSRTKVGYYIIKAKAAAVAGITEAEAIRILYVNPTNIGTLVVNNTSFGSAHAVVNVPEDIVNSGATVSYKLEDGIETEVSFTEASGSTFTIPTSALAVGTYDVAIYYANKAEYNVTAGYENNSTVTPKKAEIQKTFEVEAVQSEVTSDITSEIITGTYSLTFNGSSASESETDVDFIGFLLTNGAEDSLDVLTSAKFIKDSTSVDTGITGYSIDYYVDSDATIIGDKPDPADFASFAIDGTEYEIAYVQKGVYVIGKWDAGSEEYVAYGVVIDKTKLSPQITRNGWSFEVKFDYVDENSASQKDTKTIAIPTTEIEVDVVSGNLALNKPASANGDEGSHIAVEKAFDGDSGTRWGSSYGINPKWLQVDLQEESLITNFVIDWERRNADDYKIEVSSNGTDWTEVYAQTDFPTEFKETIALETPVSARYVRLYINNFISNCDNVNYPTVSVHEFEVYGSKKVNLALNQTASSNGEEASHFAADKAFDGGTSGQSRWASTNGINQKWLQVDLGEEVSISEVAIIWERCNATDYKLYVSNDPGDFGTPVFVGTKPSQTHKEEILLYTSARGRYVKLVIDNFQLEDATGVGIPWATVSIWEFQIYGKATGTGTFAIPGQELTTAFLLEAFAPLAPAQAVVEEVVEEDVTEDVVEEGAPEDNATEEDVVEEDASEDNVTEEETETSTEEDSLEEAAAEETETEETVEEIVSEEAVAKEII